MKAEDWIKVEDRLPEEWELVLVYYEADIIGLGYWYGAKGWLSDDDQEMATPHYWQEIVPPKED